MMLNKILIQWFWVDVTTKAQKSLGGKKKQWWKCAGKTLLGGWWFNSNSMSGDSSGPDC